MAQIFGTSGADTALTGGSADDEIYGGPTVDPSSDNTDDILTGGLGNDRLFGFGGNDFYRWSVGDGFDSIFEYAGGGAADVLTLVGVDLADIRLVRERVAVDGALFVEIGNEQLTIEAQYAGEDSVGAAVEFIELADAGQLDLAGWTDWRGSISSEILWGAGGNDVVSGLSGDDVLYGFGGSDQLFGGVGTDTIYAGRNSDHLYGNAGQDSLYGGGGNDRYYFSIGDGPDFIYEQPGEGADTLALGPGIDPSMVSIIREATRVDGDLILTIGGETIRLIDQYQGEETFAGAVEFLEFDDGSRVDLETYGEWIGNESGETIWGTSNDDRVDGLAGDDFLFGFGGNDQVSGGIGADILFGGLGNDTYLWAAGDGDDLIDETFGGGQDTLLLGAGFDRGNVTFFREATANNGDLFIRLGAETIRVANQYIDDQTVAPRLDFVEFANGDRRNLSIFNDWTGTDEGETVWGADRDDDISGLAGDDFIFGFDGGDRIIGNSGNDSLNGGLGGDVYVYGRGNGDDLIIENSGADGVDRLQFLSNVLSASVRFFREANADQGDLLIHVGASVIRVLDHYTDEQTADPRLEEVRFADGRVVDLTSLAVFDGSENSETVWGTGGDDFVRAAGGDDFLFGFDGDDRMIGGNGIDTLIGGAGFDILRGAAGRDVLRGGMGNDRYSFAEGDGSDFIEEMFGEGSSDELRFDPGIDVADVHYFREAAEENGDLLIRVADEVIRVFDQYADLASASPRLEAVRFSDGTRHDLTTWSHWTGTEAGETVWGSVEDDTVRGLGGDDFLFGFDGNDRLVGSRGNDVMQGGVGSDQYDYSSSNGDDIIIEDSVPGDVDQIFFFARIDPASVRFMRETSFENGDLLIFVGERVIRVQDQYVGQQTLDPRVEQVVFSGTGMVDLTALDLYRGSDQGEAVWGGSLDETLEGGGGNDSLFAFDGADILVGGTGDDSLVGGNGDDTYLFSTGHGADIIREAASGGADQILLMDGIGSGDLSFFREATAANGDLIIRTGTGEIRIEDQYLDQITSDIRIERVEVGTDASIDLGSLSDWTGTMASETVWGTGLDDTVRGLGGNDFVFGFEGADQLIGGQGNDTLAGGDGADIYLYQSGDGIDVINEQLGDVGEDVIALGAGIATSDVRISRELSGFSDDLIINIGTSFIQVTDHFSGVDQIAARVETLAFDDGTQLDLTNITDWFGTAASEILWGTVNSDAMAGLDGDDVINGYGGDDILDGGAGADSLNGGAGLDTASYASATGRIVADLANEARNEGDAVGDLFFSVENLRGSDFNSRLYGDGFDNALIGGARIDKLFGREGHDHLEGGSGKDVLTGGTGADQKTGGDNADRFDYNQFTDSTAASLDLILDFQTGEDVLDLSSIDADTGTSGNQTFSYIGMAGFTGSAGELRQMDDALNAQTIVEGDVDGDGVADLVIALAGLSVISDTDIIL